MAMEVSLGTLRVPAQGVWLCFTDDLSYLGTVLVKERL